MAERRRVVFWGRSLFITALQASLVGMEELETVVLDSNLPDVMGRIATLGPDFIVLDLGDERPDIAIPILRGYPGIPVIGVDLTTNSITVLSSRTYTTRTVADLVEVLRARTQTRGLSSQDGDLALS